MRLKSMHIVWSFLYEVDSLAEWPTEGRLIQVDRVMEMKSEINTIVYKN